MKAIRLGFCILALAVIAFGCAETIEPLPPGSTTGGDAGTGRDCVDNDGDGYGSGSDCRGTDCDDTNAGIWTNCENCRDNDGDGYGEGCSRGTDCDDTDRNVNPSRSEIPSNGKDDDCQNGDLQCLDVDGDGYGDGVQCRGTDCLDSDAEVHPGAREICGNGKDDDCEDGDEVCPANCTDEDSDGYGEGSDCDGTDCDDRDPEVYEGAEEVCNGKDDDCDDDTDECPTAGEECDLDRRACSGGFLQPCVRSIDCAGQYLCYEEECRGGEGVDCDTSDHCAGGFRCSTSRHCEIDPSYNICDDLDCPGTCEGGACCVRELAACVDCLDWLDCPEYDDICAGYTCMPAVDRTFDDPGDADAMAPAQRMAHWLADCYHAAGDSDIKICGIIDAYNLTSNLSRSQVIDWICDSEDTDYEGGAYNRNAARSIGGCAFGNNQNLEWETPLVAGEWYEICMWTVPNPPILGIPRDPDVFIDDCAKFPVE